jgi:hypothetical protein
MTEGELSATEVKLPQSDKAGAVLRRNEARRLGREMQSGVRKDRKEAKIAKKEILNSEL